MTISTAEAQRKSWRTLVSDVILIFSIAGTLIGIVGFIAGGWQWLLRIQQEQDQQNQRIMRIEVIVDRGILPITDERIRALERRVEYLQVENAHALQMLQEQQQRNGNGR